MSDDPVLKKIFNRFYPKSQTSDEGRKLYILAWGIEILVVLAGLATAWIMMQQTDLSDAFKLQVGLTFIIAAIAELTKIPLATAFYYAVRVNWKLLFLFALVLINILTFETIINGLQRNYQAQTKDIKQKQYDLSDIVSERVNGDLIIANDKRGIQKEIDRIDENIKRINEKRTQIQEQKKDEYANLYATTPGGGKLTELRNQKQGKLDKLDKLEDRNSDLASKSCESGLFVGGSCDNIEDQLSKNQTEIDKLNRDIRDLDLQIGETVALLDSQNDDRTAVLDEKYRTLLDQLSQEYTDYQNQKVVQNERVAALDEGSIDRIKRGKELEKQERELIKEINSMAMDNQFYNWAMLLKGSEDEDSEEDTKSWFSWFQLNVDNSETTEVKEEEESNVSTDVDNFQDTGTQIMLSQKAKKYHLLTEDDLQYAFLLFFGAMALVISVAGTMVALASLHLQDPRMQEDRKTAKRLGPIAKFFRSIQFMFISLRKRLMKPKIVEVINEKEVVVEKEVVKEVPVDQIVYRDVPKEVIRRELVHVPMYTNDKDLLGTTTFKDLDVTTEELDQALEEIRKKNKKKEKNEKDKNEGQETE